MDFFRLEEAQVTHSSAARIREIFIDNAADQRTENHHQRVFQLVVLVTVRQNQPSQRSESVSRQLVCVT